MDKKNILIIIPGLGFGGAEKFIVGLANSLSLMNFNISLVTLSNLNPIQNELNLRTEFIALPRNKKTDLKPIADLRNVIKKNNPDYVFCVGFFSFFIVALSSLFLKIKPARIVSYHTTIPFNKKEYYLTKLYLKFLKSKDFVIAVSKNQAAFTSKLYNLPENKIIAILNGISVDHWILAPLAFNKKEFREKFGIKENEKVIIMTAGFRAEKNHLGAIRALHILHKTYNTKAYLLLVGDGELRGKIEKLVTDLGLQNFVKFAGLQKDVRQFYWASDLFTLCSISETFSIAALEAMASGLPSVLTDIGGANEMIIEGFNGLLVEPSSEAIANCWNQALKQNFEPKAISEFIHKEFDQKNMVNAYSEILI